MNELSPKVKAFAERMKQLREEKNLTRMAVSKATNIHFNSITEYEKGRVPSLENLKTLKDYYDVSYEYLFGQTDIKSTNSDIQAIHKETGLSQESISILSNIKDDKKLLNILNTFIESIGKNTNLKK